MPASPSRCWQEVELNDEFALGADILSAIPNDVSGWKGDRLLTDPTRAKVFLCPRRKPHNLVCKGRGDPADSGSATFPGAVRFDRSRRYRAAEEEIQR